MDKRLVLKARRSLRAIEAQIVDDGKTVVGKKFQYAKGKLPVEQAFEFGEEFAKEALKKGVTKISYDRGESHYHGRIKAFAEGLRKAGLEF